MCTRNASVPSLKVAGSNEAYMHNYLPQRQICGNVLTLVKSIWGRGIQNLEWGAPCCMDRAEAASSEELKF
eukprot:1160088-Pelagomonas_calceolata.AAC.21